ncbi:MAG: hypothetical protein CMJ31_07570 [Phycisphaerae bacterium]|nr:hypothetical protein [Phycisphaerae bacterium]
MSQRTPIGPFFVATTLAASLAFGASATAQVAAAAGTTGTPASYKAQAKTAEPFTTPSDALAYAAELLSANQPVRAQATLRAYNATDLAVRMSDDEASRFFRLIRRTEKAVAEANPIDVSLERAELALSTDSFVEAERHAEAVIASASASNAQKASAEALLSVVEGRRTALNAKLPSLLEEANASFDRGDYDRAAAVTSRLRRAGLTMADAHRASFMSLAGRVTEMEIALGRSLDDGADVLLGAMAPTRDRGAWMAGAAVHSQPEDDMGPMQAEPMQSDMADDMASDDDMDSDDPVQMAFVQEADRLLSEANAAFEERRLNDARRRYQQVLEPAYRAHLSADEIALAERRLADSRVALRESPGPTGDVIGQVQVGRDLARQRLRAEFTNQFERAEQLAVEGDFAQARELASQARLTLSRGRQILNESEYADLEVRVENLFATIEAGEQRRAVREAEERTRLLEKRQEEAELAQRTERSRRISELLDRIYVLQQEHNYQKALEEVEQLLFIDPNNTAGKLLRDVLRDTLLFRTYSDATNDLRRGLAALSVDNAEAMVPSPDLIRYPDDWVDITERRDGGLQYTEPAINRAVIATLDNTRLPVDFQDATIENVLTFVSSFANLDMDVDWQSLEDIGIDRDTTVSLRLTNVPLRVALEKSLEKASDPGVPAGWTVRDGVLTIASDEVIREDTILEIYDIQDLLFEVPDYDNPPNFDLNTIFNQAGQGGGGGGQSPFQINQQQPDELDRETLVDELRDIIVANVDPDGWEDGGGTTGTITEYNGTFIVTNTPANHRAVSGLLRRLRSVRNLQINLESRFLVVAEDFFEQIGFDLDIYFGANTNEFQNAQLFDPSLTLANFFNFGAPIPGNTLPAVDGPETSRLGIRQGVTGSVDQFGGPITQPINAPGTQGDNFSPIGAPQNSLGLTQALGAGSAFAGEVLGVAPALGVVGRFMDDIQVDFLVEATQADRRSVQLTAPRLTFTNGQRAHISVATQQSIVTGATPVVAAGSVAFTPTLGVANSGAQLRVHGVVSADRRYVNLNLSVILSSLDFDSNSGAPTAVPVTGAAGGVGGGAGAGTAAVTITTPEASISFIETSVSVPDQGTLLLGGQRIVNEIEVETGVPILSKIPIINRFFSNRLETKEEQTLLVLIKPTIIIQNEEEERNFPGLLDAQGID